MDLQAAGQESAAHNTVTLVAFQLPAASVDFRFVRLQQHMLVCFGVYIPGYILGISVISSYGQVSLKSPIMGERSTSLAATCSV